MNNKSVETIIIDCQGDLNKITQILRGLGKFHDSVPYLTKFSIIKTSGTIEQAFKSLIFDFVEKKSIIQARNYLENTFLNNALNCNLDRIYQILDKFDDNWRKKLAAKLTKRKHGQRMKSSLNSLISARNQFAHGGNPGTTFKETKNYFKDSCIILKILDSIIK